VVPPYLVKEAPLPVDNITNKVLCFCWHKCQVTKFVCKQPSGSCALIYRNSGDLYNHSQGGLGLLAMVLGWEIARRYGCGKGEVLTGVNWWLLTGRIPESRKMPYMVKGAPFSEDNIKIKAPIPAGWEIYYKTRQALRLCQPQHLENFKKYCSLQLECWDSDSQKQWLRRVKGYDTCERRN
jgi:hypothetical protein